MRHVSDCVFILFNQESITGTGPGQLPTHTGKCTATLDINPRNIMALTIDAKRGCKISMNCKFVKFYAQYEMNIERYERIDLCLEYFVITGVIAFNKSISTLEAGIQCTLVKHKAAHIFIKLYSLR